MHPVFVNPLSLLDLDSELETDLQVPSKLTLVEVASLPLLSVPEIITTQIELEWAGAAPTKQQVAATHHQIRAILEKKRTLILEKLDARIAAVKAEKKGRPGDAKLLHILAGLEQAKAIFLEIY
jgi:hypothetical protein